jgi:hypothetical protein
MSKRLHDAPQASKGDRFYFANDQGLSFIKNNFGIDFHHALAQIISLNTDIPASRLNPTGNVFFLPDAALPATTCQVTYSISNVTTTTFKGTLQIKNTSSSTISNWQVAFGLYQGQVLQNPVTGATFAQSGPNSQVKTANGVAGNNNIAPGATVTATFTSTWDGFVNQKPPNINMPGRRCAVV